MVQHRALARELVDRVAAATGRTYPWELVYQSRSGPPQVPWLEPTSTTISSNWQVWGHERGRGADRIVSDHMEVVQDLDTEAAQTADSLGLAFHRVATVGTTGFRRRTRRLGASRAGARSRKRSSDEALPTPCLPGCCPNPRVQRPALCEGSA